MAKPNDRLTFEAHLADVVDKTASPELLDLIANDDELRDARYAAEEVVRLLAHAADDVPDELDAPSTTAAMPVRLAPVPVAPAATSSGMAPAPIVAVGTTSAAAAAPSAAAAAPGVAAGTPADAAPAMGVVAGTPAGAAPDQVAAAAVAAGTPAGAAPAQLDSPGANVAPAAPSTLTPRSPAIWVALSLLIVLVVVALLWGASSKTVSQTAAVAHPVRGTLTKIEIPSDAGHVEVCEGNEGACRAAKVDGQVGPGMAVRTNAKARANLVLDGGDSIALDRSTAISLGVGKRYHLRLNAGTVVIGTDAVRASTLVVEFPSGRAELDRAKCAITAESAQVLIEVTRGKVKLFDRDGHEQTILAGETGQLKPGRGIDVTYSRLAGNTVADNEFTDDSAENSELERGLGELRAQKPGETTERNNAVRLSRHDVKIHIVGAIAKTEIDETFTNDTNDVLEGIFRFPLPADAQIERLALEVDGRLVEGAFTDRDRASAIWRGSIVQAAPQLRAQIRDEIIWVPGPWRDPALLEWQRGNRFELRIFPIPKQGSRRIVISYTQVVPGTTGMRRYSYPLPRHSSDLRGVEDFSLRLELRGHDVTRPPTITGYEGKLTNTSAEMASFAVAERQFLPRGDLVVDYELPSSQRDVIAWAHQPKATAENPYVAWLLRPKLPRSSEQSPQAYAFVVDTSRSMIGESLRRASALTTRMIRELSRDNSVVVLACDSECRKWPEGLAEGGKLAAGSAERWLRTQTAEGASDLTHAIAAAQEALGSAGRTRRHVVYVGDGTPTAGPTRPVTITREVRRSIGASAANVTVVAIGTDSDLESLRAVARGGRGVVVPYVPGMSVTRAAYAALAATHGTRLVDARLELPPGVIAVAPERIDTVAAGDELLVVGRLERAGVLGDVVLHGRVEDRAFEQRYSVDLRPAAGEANAFVPRLYAAARLFDLERRGDSAAKSEAIELSRRFNVASRYTSLLVLESQAMFDAFGLDNRRKSEVWTGELEASVSGGSADDESNPEDASLAVSESAQGSMAVPSRGSGDRLASGAAAADVGKAAAPAMAELPSAQPEASKKKESSAANQAGAAAPRRAAEITAPKPAVALSPRGRPLAALDEEMERTRRPIPRQRMVPMRRIWERKGEVIVGLSTPSNASRERLQAAERELSRNPDRRSSTKQLFDLYAKSGELGKAADLAEQWSQRDALDVEALIARADMAARQGDRPLAIRILGSVVDVRPGDTGAQQRLSRLYRWQGQPERACRFSMALSEFRPNDEKALAEAMRCLRDGASAELSQELKSAVTERVLRAAEHLLEKPRTVDALSGDLRLTATWPAADGVDVDLALIDPEGHRVSWLGAPTRSVISATHVTSQHEEGLALRGGKPGEYLLELSRGSGTGTVRGTIVIQVAGTRREIPFTLDGERATLGTIKITMVSRLVPLENSTMWMAQ